MPNAKDTGIETGMAIKAIVEAAELSPLTAAAIYRAIEHVTTLTAVLLQGAPPAEAEKVDSVWLAALQAYVTGAYKVTDN